MSFAMTVARNTSWSELAGSLWSRSTRIAYSELEHDFRSELAWSVAVSLSLSTTPSTVMLCTWRMEEEVLWICCSRLGQLRRFLWTLYSSVSGYCLQTRT